MATRSSASPISVFPSSAVSRSRNLLRSPCPSAWESSATSSSLAPSRSRSGRRPPARREASGRPSASSTEQRSRVAMAREAPPETRRAGDARLRFSGSTPLRIAGRRRRPQRKRAALRFVTGWKPGERLSAPVAEYLDMAKAAKKIVFSRSRDIPFNKLVLSESNVRRTRPEAELDELIHDIDRREDLVQGLNVRAILDADGKETGMFEVPAGGRRYRAIERLVKAKRFPKDGLVPCIVRKSDTRILAEDDSLAENLLRPGLHPLDQFRAFQDMLDKGMTEEEIAAAYLTTVQVVKQRLRLNAVSPVLRDAYAEERMTLDMLMAFTVNPDLQRQEQVWEAVQHSYNRQPWHIRQLLTETTIPASDKRARFVGIDAYVAAGGAVLRDLFEEDDGGWLADPALLHRLVSEKLSEHPVSTADYVRRGRLDAALRDQRFASWATCSPSQPASMMLGSKSSAIHSLDSV